MCIYIFLLCVFVHMYIYIYKPTYTYTNTYTHTMQHVRGGNDIHAGFTRETWTLLLHAQYRSPINASLLQLHRTANSNRMSIAGLLEFNLCQPTLPTLSGATPSLGASAQVPGFGTLNFNTLKI